MGFKKVITSKLLNCENVLYKKFSVAGNMGDQIIDRAMIGHVTTTAAGHKQFLPTFYFFL